MGKHISIADVAFLKNSGITPSSFPNLLRWYRADSYVGLVDGDKVGGGAQPGGPWSDLSGNLDNATNVSGPTYRTNIVGTKPALDFTGSFLSFAPGALTDFTFVAAAARNGGDCLLCYNNITATQITRSFGGSNTPYIYIGGTFVNSDPLSGGNNDFMVITVRRSGGVISFRQNKTNRNGGALAGNFTVLQIGASAAGAEMYLGELVMWNRALSDVECDSLYDGYLKPRWVTLP